METFNYYKLILTKVSFDSSLFKHELLKAKQKLLPKSYELLKQWLQQFVLDKPSLELVVQEVG